MTDKNSLEYEAFIESLNEIEAKGVTPLKVPLKIKLLQAVGRCILLFRKK